jgi:elongation factor G
VDFLPSPGDVKEIGGQDYTKNLIYRKPNNKEPFSSLVFKITSDKFGQLTYLRVYSGLLNKGDYVLNTRNQKKNKNW